MNWLDYLWLKWYQAIEEKNWREAIDIARSIEGMKSYIIPNEQASMFHDTPSMPVLNIKRCFAKLINYETAARMVETHHYLHRVPNITTAIGMYVDNLLAGCVTYGSPANINMLSFCSAIERNKVLELNRLFVHDWAGRNSESWLISQSFKFLDVLALISYADIDRGHIGYVYQATNWLYTGISKGDTEWIIENKKYHRKSIYEKFGTSNLEKVKKVVNTDILLNKESDKYRYVYFLGSKLQRKEFRKKLKWPILPYPKE